ncbi:ligand-binding protein SH3 [Candidatus Woesearchaeota archaeon]|nr:MAG: ligand-binding protein SH3 [Candidatus Woesearchaeota archaeon]
MAFSLPQIVQMAALTLVPGLELRASIPFGIIKLGLDPLPVFAVCVLFNVLLGPLVYAALSLFVETLRKAGFIDALYSKIVVRTRKRARPYVERFGFIGLALFIAVPLPGSGSYSGALAAYLFGMDLRKFSLANLVGVLIAGIIVTFLTLTGNYLFLKLV